MEVSCGRRKALCVRTRCCNTEADGGGVFRSAQNTVAEEALLDARRQRRTREAHYRKFGTSQSVSQYRAP